VGYEAPDQHAPAQWSQSMVEDAIAEGKPIPIDMKPAGYAGPVFEIQNPVVEVE